MDQIARSPKQIGAAIRQIRRKRSISQAQLGEMAGLRQATISKIENGEAATKIGTICDILAALDVEFLIRSRTKSDPKDIEDIF